MHSRISLWHSLRTRATVFTLAVFVLSIGALSSYATRLLQADMERVLGEQQFQAVSVIATQVNAELQDRQEWLGKVARQIDPQLMGNPQALQTHLEQRLVLLQMFNGGVWVAGLDGTAIADVPRTAQRLGFNYLSVDFIAAVLKEGKTIISGPVMGKKLRTPVVAMAMPIRDAQGRVIGVMSGVSDLGKPSFLDKIAQGRYGQSGGYLLIAPQHQLIVTASDKSRIMQPLPAPGLNTMHDRYMQGYEGFGVAVNSRGMEELSAAKGIPVAGWFLVAVMPTAEAFATVYAMQQRMILVTLLLTLLTGVLTWWILKRQLLPLVATADAMATLADSNQMARPLPTKWPDEIGHLVNGFNRILALWTQREAALMESQQNLATTLNSIGDAVIATDAAGLIMRMNPTAERLTAWPLADALEKPLTDVFRIISSQTRLPAQNPVQLVMEHGKVVGLANHTALLARDGREYQIADSAAPIRNAADQIVGVVLVFSDVTDKYRAEEALRHGKDMLERTESLARVASFEWDVESNTVAWSPEMFRLFGRDPALGIPNLEGQAQLYTPASTQTLFDAVGKAVSDGTPYTIELMTVQPDGALRPCTAKGFPERDASGRVVRIAGLVQDITERKQAEAAILASEARWKFAIEGAGDGLWDWNIQTGKAFYSPRYKTMLGFAEDEIGDSADEWSQRIHPDDAPGVFATMQPYMDGMLGNTTVEFRMLCKDGSWMWTMGRGMVVQRDAEGKPLRMIGTNTDITQRKREQEKLQLAAGVFTHALEGIMITMPDATIMDVNEAFTRITGYSREDAVGQNPRILKSGRQDMVFYEGMWRNLTEQGHWSGEVWNRRKSGEVYAELLTISAVRDGQGNTQHYVALFSDITAMKAHQSQLEHIAHFDALTNLPNRLLLADRLQQAMAQAQRRAKQVAVAYLDLDGFKNVNDLHGHDVGDQLLVTLANAMKATLREGDTLARLGGDEFVAVLIDLEGIESCLPMLTRLLEAAAAPVPLGERVLQGSASIGVTFYPQTHDIESDQLLRQADQAMYQAKLAGKNRYHFFDAVQDSSVRVHHESLERIRLALENREFVLHYQPKVNMHSGQVIGVEALIRWQWPWVNG